MKAKLFLLVFVVAGGCWALVVSVAAAMHGFSFFGVAAPYAGIALGTLGGFLIGALGLRMYTKADAQNFIKDCNSRARLAAANGNDPLVPCQVGHREAYFDPRAR
jgi:hypothetical protein